MPCIKNGDVISHSGSKNSSWSLLRSQIVAYRRSCATFKAGRRRASTVVWLVNKVYLGVLRSSSAELWLMCNSYRFDPIPLLKKNGTLWKMGKTGEVPNRESERPQHFGQWLRSGRNWLHAGEDSDSSSERLNDKLEDPGVEGNGRTDRIGQYLPADRPGKLREHENPRHFFRGSILGRKIFFPYPNVSDHSGARAVFHFALTSAEKQTIRILLSYEDSLYSIGEGPIVVRIVLMGWFELIY